MYDLKLDDDTTAAASRQGEAALPRRRRSVAYAAELNLTSEVVAEGVKWSSGPPAFLGLRKVRTKAEFAAFLGQYRRWKFRIVDFQADEPARLQRDRGRRAGPTRSKIQETVQ